MMALVVGPTCSNAFLSGSRMKHNPLLTTTNTNKATSSLMMVPSSEGNDSDNEKKRPAIFWNENDKKHMEAMKKSCTSFILAATLFFVAPSETSLLPSWTAPQQSSGSLDVMSMLPRLEIPSASAADYNSFSPEQKTIAEAWRVVDSTFIDRTFNNQDWFQMRQDAVNRKQKYKSMEEAQESISKLVDSLGDKYTRYLSPAKLQSIVDSATGTLAGVGIEISMNKETKQIFASDVEANSPAEKGGIKPLDRFVEVDGYTIVEGVSTPDDVANKLRGPVGSKVGVVMQRGSNGNNNDFILTRDKITVTSVKPYLSQKSIPNVGKVGVIRIKSFSGTTAATVSSAIDDLKAKGANAFVLDVRANPGGLLPGGVDTASLFLDANQPVVFVVNNKGVVDKQETFNKGKELDSSLVVVVNSGTASAAEVMTAALQENKRAMVVGEQTFGKGIVQTIRTLENNNGGVAVTVARYETPLHHDINKQGIPVDIKVKTEDCPPTTDVVLCLPDSAFAKP